MTTGGPTQQEERVQRRRPHRKRWWALASLVVVLPAAAILSLGLVNLLSGPNLHDFMRLREFTSPSHQQDRCKTEAAFNAQEKMYNYFAKKGGVSKAEAAAIAPSVGLTPQEVKAVLNNKLFQISYDCTTPTASTQTATLGLAEIVLGVGVLLGAGVMAAIEHVTRRAVRQGRQHPDGERTTERAEE